MKKLCIVAALVVAGLTFGSILVWVEQWVSSINADQNRALLYAWLSDHIWYIVLAIGAIWIVRRRGGILLQALRRVTLSCRLRENRAAWKRRFRKGDGYIPFNS